jgi:hypothetical protein
MQQMNKLYVDGIYVINLTTEKAVITDDEGYFEMGSWGCL